MTENRKPKPDFLKLWLIIVTVISGPVWFIIAYVFTDILIFDFGYFGAVWKVEKLFLLSWILGIVLLPTILVSSWIFWRQGKRKLSTLFSLIQILHTYYVFVTHTEADWILGITFSFLRELFGR
jgi:hypothetical protein